MQRNRYLAKVVETKDGVKSSLKWLVLLLPVLTFLYYYFSSNIYLEFIQPVDRAYEFSINNNAIFDKTIKTFKINVPPQPFILETTEDVFLKIDENGNPIPPYTYIPAVEFNELNDQIIPANTKHRFRIPPLSSIQWLEQQAVIVDVKFIVESSNYVINIIDSVFNFLRLKKSKYNYRYVVIDNYWSRIVSGSNEEALRIYCRDNGINCSDFSSMK